MQSEEPDWSLVKLHGQSGKIHLKKLENPHSQAQVFVLLYRSEGPLLSQGKKNVKIYVFAEQICYLTP